MDTPRSLIFKYYNRAKEQTKPGGKLEKGRVNRALGLCLSKERYDLMLKKYQTTVIDCTCPDRTHRVYWCKHRVAVGIMYRVKQDIQKQWLQ